MYLEAAHYENSLKELLLGLDKWDKELNDYEALISKKKEAGEVVAGMEINLMKGNKRYNATFEAIAAANAYIKSMQHENEELHRALLEMKELKRMSHDARAYRRLLRDM